MNIFYLSHNVKMAAEWHTDKHLVKMITEHNQMLSTAHRILDGKQVMSKSKSGRNAKRWQLDDSRDSILYSVTHMNHPSAVWCRGSSSNYQWLYEMTLALCKEYTHRYGKVHKAEHSGLMDVLSVLPTSIARGEFTQPPQAMPDEFKVEGNSVLAYQNYYNGPKSRMFWTKSGPAWKNRPVPAWVVLPPRPE